MPRPVWKKGYWAATLLLGASQAAGFSQFVDPLRGIHRSSALAAGESADENTGDDSTNDIFEELRKRREALQQQNEEFGSLGGTDPALFSPPRPPSKSEVYSEDQLGSLWELHQQLSAATPKDPLSTDEPHTGLPLWEEPSDEMGDGIIPSLHDLILDTVSEIEADSTDATGETAKVSSRWCSDELLQRATRITSIASDVDGTLTGSSTQKLHERTEDAVCRAIQSAFSPVDPLRWFFPATGKTQEGVLTSVGPEVAALLQQCPGVYIQGLYCVYQGKVIYEQKLGEASIRACAELLNRPSVAPGTSVIAYDGNTLYTTDLTPTVIDLHEKYGEPLSKEIPSLLPEDYPNGFHKILVCHEDTDFLTTIVRPQLEEVAAANHARVTQAVPTMLELLPEGCSKALGVRKVCEVLGIHPETELLALGDAENDVEMLEMAAIGVAMGNACPLAKEAADAVVDQTSDEGGAGIAMDTLVLSNR